MLWMTMPRSLPSSTTFKERIESLKAGLVGAAALVVGFFMMSGANRLILQGIEQLPWSPTQATRSAADIAQLLHLIDWTQAEWWLSGAIASFSGFLFGVTYRYIIRTDDNSHLKTGAVGAFGLVRGLTQLDTGMALHANVWHLLILAGESMVLFAIAQLALDLSLSAGAFQPLRQSDAV